MNLREQQQLWQKSKLHSQVELDAVADFLNFVEGIPPAPESDGPRTLGVQAFEQVGCLDKFG